MKHINISSSLEEFEFVKTAANRFENNPMWNYFTEKQIVEGELIALKWGLVNDCILVFKIGDEPRIYDQIIRKNYHKKKEGVESIKVRLRGEFEAIQWNESHETIKKIGAKLGGHSGHVDDPDLCDSASIQTEAGSKRLYHGDWIVRDERNHHLVYTDDEFKKMFESI